MNATLPAALLPLDVKTCKAPAVVLLARSIAPGDMVDALLRRSKEMRLRSQLPGDFADRFADATDATSARLHELSLASMPQPIQAIMFGCACEVLGVPPVMGVDILERTSEAEWSKWS